MSKLSIWTLWKTLVTLLPVLMVTFVYLQPLGTYCLASTEQQRKTGILPRKADHRRKKLTESLWKVRKLQSPYQQPSHADHDPFTFLQFEGAASLLQVLQGLLISWYDNQGHPGQNPKIKFDVKISVAAHCLRNASLVGDYCSAWQVLGPKHGRMVERISKSHSGVSPKPA